MIFIHPNRTLDAKSAFKLAAGAGGRYHALVAT
jgi:hypothetical protein